MINTVLRDKQTLHIAVEFITLCGLIFYFNQKNKSMLVHIQNLAQRVEEQEDILQKHENIISKLTNVINQLSSQLQQIEKYQPHSNNHQKQSAQYNSQQHTQQKNKQHKDNFKKVSFYNENKEQLTNNLNLQKTPILEEITEEDSDSDSDNSLLDDLDLEISQELNELDSDLKKEE